jgi:predicted DNA-binding ribbon-helix-helix protein
MATAKRAHAKSARTKHVRRSVTLPAKIAKQVETLARQRALSDNRVLVELIEQGIEAQQQKEKAFFRLAERFRAASDPEQVKQLGDQLGRFVFGDLEYQATSEVEGTSVMKRPATSQYRFK